MLLPDGVGSWSFLVFQPQGRHEGMPANFQPIHSNFHRTHLETQVRA